MLLQHYLLFELKIAEKIYYEISLSATFLLAAEMGLEPITHRDIMRLLYPLSYSANATAANPVAG